MKKFTPPFLILLALIISAAVIYSINPQTLRTSTLSDIGTHQYKNAIEFISSRNIVQGYPDGTFKPDQTINRAELLKIILESKLTEEYLNSFADTDCFVDVPAGEWFTKYVCAAKEKEIIKGYADGTFKPAQAVNFAEALKILTNAYDLNIAEGTTVWYEPIVNNASGINIIPQDTIAFDQPLTRAQMAEMITRMIKHNENTLDEYISENETPLTYEKIENRQSNIALNTTNVDDTIPPTNLNIPPLNLLPYVSNEEAKKNICALDASRSILKFCDEEYASLTIEDREDIYELFLTLQELDSRDSLSDMEKFLTSQLVFSILPNEETHSFLSMLVAYAGNSLQNISDEYLASLEEDIQTIKQNCPAEGYENYSFSGMCSIYDFTKENSIYSKKYAEAGGPCVFDDAGATELCKVQSITTANSSSKQDFINKLVSSNKVACSFSCVSYNCPKYEEEEAERKACMYPVYIPFIGYDSIAKIPTTAIIYAFENIETECEARGEGCKIEKGTCDFYKSDYYSRPAVLQSCCCSCKRKSKNVTSSEYDFTQSGYDGRSLLDDLLDSVEDVPRDVTVPPGDVTLPPPPVDAPALCGEEYCSDETCCSSTCVNTDSSNSHCGTCDNPCDTARGFSCRSGSCQCPNDKTLCGITCVDTDSDNNNCGACSNVCDTDDGYSCVDGECEKESEGSIIIQFDCVLEMIRNSGTGLWENHITYSTFPIDEDYNPVYAVPYEDIYPSSWGSVTGGCYGDPEAFEAKCQNPFTNQVVDTAYLANYKTYSLDDYTAEEINADITAAWENMVYDPPCD
ncbi:MAG: S-layer homology domain-containing protein [Candidatus Peregrinibacteria bacterium]